MPTSTSHPRVSIVIPTYNRPDSLYRAMLSVAAQDYDDVELVVVDDGAVVPGTKETTDRFAMEYEHIAVRYVTQKNTGISGARNTGVKNASGDFIAFLDDDDVFFPNYISAILGAFDRSEDDYEAAISDWIIEDPNGRSSYSVSLKSVLKCPGNGWMFKRSVFFEKNLWYDETYRFDEDFELGLRSWNQYKIIFLHVPLFKYSARLPLFAASSAHLSGDKKNYLFLKSGIEKNAAIIRAMDPRDQAIIEYHVGLFAGQAGLMALARRHIGRAIKLDFSAIRFCYFCATFFGQRGFMVVRVSASRLMRRIVVWRTRKEVEKYRDILKKL